MKKSSRPPELRYVVTRRMKSGRVHHYWIRRGHAAVTLPGEAVARFAEAARLNGAADANDGRQKTGPGSFADIIEKYRASDQYAELAVNTRNAYESILRRLPERWLPLPIRAITRGTIKQMFDGIPKAGTKNIARAVLSNLFTVAMDYDYVALNPVLRMRLKAPARRREYWLPEDRAAYFDGAADCGEAEAMALAFNLMLYTAQRPSDVLQTVEYEKAVAGNVTRHVRPGMLWNAYDGDLIKVRQQKTGTLLEIPAHKELRRALDGSPRRGLHIVSFKNGKPFQYDHWKRRFNEIRDAAGLDHLQTRDLRRTAVVMMFEAECEVGQIAAVTGHSLKTVESILETYFVRTTPMARAAVAKLEDHAKRKGKGK